MDDIIIDKYSMMYHISKNKDIKLDNSRLYVTHSIIDSKIYQGIMGTTENEKLYKHEYITMKELVIPSYEKRVDLFIEEFKKDTFCYWESLWLLSCFISENIKPDDKKYLPDYTPFLNPLGYKNIENYEDLRNDGYRLFSFGLDMPYPATISYFEKLKSLGYNALIDDLDRMPNGIIKPIEPLIILNAQDTLFELMVIEITEEDIQEGKEALMDMESKSVNNFADTILTEFNREAEAISKALMDMKEHNEDNKK